MLTYIPVIPAREQIERGEPLNLLGGVANDGDATTVEVRVWGRVDAEWTVLASQRVQLLSGEHRHLYFTLPPECFSAALWGEEIEDIELRMDHRTPKPGDRGIIVFVD